jgi:hypothetical protein
MPNGYTSPVPTIGMDDIDPDTLMVLAGVVISLIAALELYSAWKQTRGSGR